MIESLSVINAISIDREIYTDGHSPLLVIGEDYNQYIVKNSSGRIPAFYLINEFLANGLLQCWNIPTPECANIQVDSSIIRGFSNKHRPAYYNDSTFGSKVIPNILDLNEYTLSNTKSSYNRLINPLDILRIGLFDLWVANDDRKPTNQNTILSIGSNGKYEITAIDHAFIFETLDYQHLNPQLFYPSVNDHIMICDLVNIVKRYTNINDSFVSSERDYFYFCLNTSQESFEKITNNIPNDLGITDSLITFLEQFLFNQDRNNRVFEEYTYRLLM